MGNEIVIVLEVWMLVLMAIALFFWFLWWTRDVKTDEEKEEERNLYLERLKASYRHLSGVSHSATSLEGVETLSIEEVQKCISNEIERVKYRG